MRASGIGLVAKSEEVTDKRYLVLGLIVICRVVMKMKSMSNNFLFAD